MVVLAPLVHVLAVEEEVRDAVREREGRHHDAVHHEELVLAYGRVDAAGLDVLGHHAVAFLEGARRDEAAIAERQEVVGGHLDLLASLGLDLVEVATNGVGLVRQEEHLGGGYVALAVRAQDHVANLYTAAKGK